MDLKNKSVVFVGGVGGIGVETCKLLMPKNIRCLVLLDKCENREALNVIKAINLKVPVHFMNFDVTMDLDAMKKKFAEIISKIERIDIFINGASIGNDLLIESTIETNLIGLINTNVAAIDHMDRRHGGTGGVIVNIACKGGLSGYSSMPVYCASKAGVVMFTSCVAKLEPLTGITTFVFCPGLTLTPMIHAAVTFLNVDDEFVTRIAVMDEIMTPENVATNFVSTIESCRNGAIWLLHHNELSAVKIPNYWNPPEALLEKWKR